MFMDSPSFRSLTVIARPSWKTLAGRFNKLVSDRRAADKGFAAASGIAEIHGEREQLLDDGIAQIDEEDDGDGLRRRRKRLRRRRSRERARRCVTAL